MHINGTRYDLKFKDWVHKPMEDGGNVVGIGEDNLRACFSRHVWDSEKGKVDLGDVFHSVEELLDQEECLSCDKDKVFFPMELEQVVVALDAYKGKKDITPLPHSIHDDDYGFYPRSPEV